jgi:hypothetical protein
MNYKLVLYFSQQIDREVEANSPQEAEEMGYKIIDEIVELKAINPDVVIIDK